jgi:eukaryotic-like serine/threonine-protein kinase
VDSRSDLYSFGVLIFRMLMGLPPFISDDLGELFKQIIKGKTPRLIVDDDKVKDDVQDLVRKLLRKQPAKRFDNAAKLTAELLAIQAKMGNEKRAQRGEFVSLRLRWTATMAGVVFVAMCIGLAIVYFMQYRALSGITFDYGRSIARMLAFESSEPILLDDAIGLRTLVSETSSNQQLKSVFVMDNDGTILAATDAKLVGQKFIAPGSRELKQSLDNTHIYQREIGDKQVLFDIEVPIVYSDKPLGNLYLSISAESMYAASKTALVTMLAVMMITLVVVFMVTLVLARRTSKDYQRITQALTKLSLGRVDSRLISDRNDEAGQLFAAFNRLATFMESRFESHPKSESSEIERATIKRSTPKNNENEIAETVELDIISTSSKDQH